MKFIIIVVAIRLLIAAVFPRRDKVPEKTSAPRRDVVVHPAEFPLR